MDYLIRTSSGEIHFFYKPDCGIYESREKNMFFPEKIIGDVKAAFCVAEKDGALHLICENLKNELVYIRIEEERTESCVLCVFKEEMKLKNIKIGVSKIGLNLIYAVEYEGKTMLVHCVLGNNAQPAVIDYLKSDNFFVYNQRVYYSNSEGALGYQEFADGKPDGFILVCEGAEDAYVSGGMLVYKKNDKIYINGKVKIEDSDIETPVIAERGESFFLVWRSGNVLKYIDACKDDIMPKKLISSGKQILYSIQENDRVHYDYADKCEGKPYFRRD